MSQPASEPLPPGATALIFLFRQEVTLLRVFNEFIIQLTRDVLVDDQGIDLIVEAQTAGIEVRTANCTELPVDHHDLRVVEARTVSPDLRSPLHQFAEIVIYYIRH